MNNQMNRHSLFVTGFSEDTERSVLKSEFSKFGQIEKLFLDCSGTYAKIFFTDQVSCEKVIRELRNSSINWRVEYNKDSYRGGKKSFGASKMGSYGNYYEDEEDFSENSDYCNVHGQPLVVLQAESGDLYVNLKDVRKTGFAIYRKDNFDPLLVDKRQIGKEFELHLLSEAHNYLLKNRAVIDEEQILQTIQRCKNKLLGGSETKSNFGPGRSVAPSSKNNFTITSEVEVTPSAKFPVTPQAQMQRVPKSLPGNFVPTNTQRNNTYKTGNREQEPRQEQEIRRIQNNPTVDTVDRNNSFADNKNKNNGFVNGFDVSIQKKEQSLNASGSSDSRNSNHSRSSRTPRITEKIGKLTFEPGKSYNVQTVFNEKENIWWVQEKDSTVLDDMFLQINEMEADLEPINPIPGQLVIALFEEAWNRGRVISVDPLKVHFIDFGNKCEVEVVKPLPDVFKKIPELAARVTNNKVQLHEITDLHIRIKTQYDGGTYLVEVVDDVHENKGYETRAAKPAETKQPEVQTKAAKPAVTKQPEPPQEKLYFKIPEPMSEIANDDKVMVIDTEGDKFFVRTRQCATKCKELTEYIKNLDKTALTLTNVKVGQLVLCSKDGLVGLYRAVVTKKESGSVVTVKYIDFPGEDELSVKSLRNVDEYLAQEPASILLSPRHKDLVNMEEKVAEYIEKICQNKSKFTVVLSGNDFDLQFDDGLLLSERIQDLKAPIAKQKTVKPTEEIHTTSTVPDQKEKQSVDQPSTTTETIVLYEEMDWIKIDSGAHTFVCYCLQDLNDITMISTTQDVITYLEQITDLDVTDNTPYTPQEFEMCLVAFKGPEDENASWYRAVVLEIEDDGYLVTFVDFGNKEVVKRQDIRKFPPHLKEVPILGVTCKCVGLPDTPEILKQMKEMIPEGEQVDVIVKGLSDLAYEIEIPDIYKTLKSKGLY